MDNLADYYKSEYELLKEKYNRDIKEKNREITKLKEKNQGKRLL